MRLIKHFSSALSLLYYHYTKTLKKLQVGDPYTLCLSVMDIGPMVSATITGLMTYLKYWCHRVSVQNRNKKY